MLDINLIRNEPDRVKAVLVGARHAVPKTQMTGQALSLHGAG